MYSEDFLKNHSISISKISKSSSKQSSDASRNSHSKGVKVLAITTACSILLGVTVLATPSRTVAFWPLNGAQAASSDAPILHDTSLGLLQAALNPDPNPTKGGTELALAEGSALIPNSGPEGTIPEGGEISTGGSISLYTVQEGDTLSEIGQKFGVSGNTILWANDITDPKTITVGTKLIILPVSGIQHTVVAGDTLSSLAKKFDADASDIAAFNRLGSDANLIVGTEVIIPGGEIAAPVKSSPSKNTKTTKSSSKTTSTSSSSKSSIKTGGSLSLLNPYKGGSGSAMDGYFGNPVPGALLTQSIHGWNGVDLGAPNGTTIYAAAAGTVIISKVGGWNGGYGNYVVIDHGNGIQTLYAHMSSDSVSVGESVSKGERIGAVGITGEATGYHLHFEVRGAKNPFADCEEMTHCSPE